MTLAWGSDFEFDDELIPSCPSAQRTGIQDPREPQQILHRTYGQRTSWKPNYEKGELTITCGSAIPILNEIQYEAAAFRKLAPLSRIILLVEPEIYREHHRELEHLKFFRDERREDSHSRSFAVVRECPVRKAA